MKNNQIKIYAEALAGALLDKKNDEKKVAKNFLLLLIKLGYQSKARKIVELAEEIILKKKGNKKITLESARKLTAENRALLKKFVKDGDIVKEKVNPDLIAGIKVVINNEKQFDNSLKSKLQNIF
jgi:F0F1-type ATP synthase delta subunit